MLEGSESDEQSANSGGVTLLSQLANMPSMSPLITSPVPSVGSVVPNMQNASIIVSNGLTQQQTPEVAKDVEIADDQPTEQ